MYIGPIILNIFQIYHALYIHLQYLNKRIKYIIKYRIFYTFEYLKRRLISVKNQLRFEVLPSVKTTDGRTFSYNEWFICNHGIFCFMSHVFTTLKSYNSCNSKQPQFSLLLTIYI